MKQIPIYRHVGGRYYGSSARFAEVGRALVDDWWFDRLSNMGVWFERKGSSGVRYARLQGTGGPGIKEVRMHQVIGGFGWDHRDGDGLNNQESNLRPANPSQQAANRRLRRNSKSGEPCVSWCKDRGKWLVQIVTNRKVAFHQYYDSYEEGVQVARQKRQEIHGPFVRG